MLDAGMVQRVIGSLREQPAADPLSVLSDQEKKVLELIGEGRHQPTDRRTHVPGRKDDKELRVIPSHQAGHATAHTGGRILRPAERKSGLIAADTSFNNS